MRIVAFLTDPPTLQAILLHLDLPHQPPPVAPARAPPQADFPLDQTPEFDLTEPEPVPDIHFDQSVPDSFEVRAACQSAQRRDGSAHRTRCPSNLCCGGFA